MDIASALRTQRMGVYRWYAVALCVLCNMMDGLDMLLVSYALPHLPDGFATNGQKGLLISIGFVGVGLGSVFLAPLADRFGRKRLIVGAMTVGTIALLVTATVHSVETMMAMRFVTGLAIGVIMPLVHVLGDEYSSQNRRGLSVGIVAIGFPLGSMLGGIISLYVINAFDGEWHALFWFGGAVSLVVTILVAATMPESPVYLGTTGGARDHARITRTSQRMGLVGVDPLARPIVQQNETTANGKKAHVLSPQFRFRSIVLWIGYTCGVVGYYFINTWTPQLISTATGSAETGALIGTTISFGAIAGGIAVAVFSLRVLPTKLAWLALGTAAVVQVVFALTLSGGLAIISAILLGFFMQAALSSYLTSATRVYPASVRARAVGFTTGFSRVGAITAPLIVGSVLAIISARTMYLTSAVVVLAAGLMAFLLWNNTKSELAAEDETIAASSGDDEQADTNQPATQTS